MTSSGILPAVPELPATRTRSARIPQRWTLARLAAPGAKAHTGVLGPGDDRRRDPAAEPGGEVDAVPARNPPVHQKRTDVPGTEQVGDRYDRDARELAREGPVLAVEAAGERVPARVRGRLAGVVAWVVDALRRDRLGRRGHDQHLRAVGGEPGQGSPHRRAEEEPVSRLARRHGVPVAVDYRSDAVEVRDDPDVRVLALGHRGDQGGDLP